MHVTRWWSPRRPPTLTISRRHGRPRPLPRVNHPPRPPPHVLTALPTDATVLTLLAASGLAGAAAQRTKIGAILSAPLAAMVAGGAAAFTGALPAAHPTYDALWSLGIPVAACLALLENGHDTATFLSPAARAVLPAFAVASLATIAATLAAWRLAGGAARLGAHGWQLAGALAASYVGGSVNLAATAASVGLPAAGGHLTAALAADNVAMAAYFVALAAVPVESSGSPAGGSTTDLPPTAAATPLSLLTAVATAAACVSLGTAITAALHAPSWALAAAAGLASMVAAVAPPRAFTGADTLSTSLMALFFAAAGAQAGSRGALAAAAPLARFVATLLAVQLAATLGVGARLLHLDRRALVVAANAAVGGPATAAAFAAARGWGDLVRPAVLVGCLGYGVGTGVGVGVATLLKGW